MEFDLSCHNGYSCGIQGLGLRVTIMGIYIYTVINRVSNSKLNEVP